MRADSLLPERLIFLGPALNIIWNMSHSSQPTMADVARAAGVSRSTVSYALQGDQRIRPATRELVLQTAEALGYQINRAAAILSSREFRSRGDLNGCRIALVDCSQNQKTGSTMAREIGEAQIYAKGLGHELEHWKCREHDSLVSLGRQLYAQGYDGLIFWRLMGEEAATLEIRELGLERFSLVSVGTRPKQVAMDVVRPDFYGIVQRAFEYLLAGGCKRIGCILRHHSPLEADDRERRAAFSENASHHLSVDHQIPLQSVQFGVAFDIGHWFEKHQPDGIISLFHWDLVPLLTSQLTEKTPQAVALNIPPTSSPICEGFEENRLGVYHEAINQLDQKMRRKQRGLSAKPIQTLVPHVWHRNGSQVQT